VVAVSLTGDLQDVVFTTTGPLISWSTSLVVSVNKRDRVFVEEIHVPQQITGYEYEFIACKKALEKGILEPFEMPHEETLYIMQFMDQLRERWGIRYPMD
jgi:hypothetical protein